MTESMGNVEGMQGNEGTLTGEAEAENQSIARLQQLIQDLRRQYNGDQQKAIAEAQRQWRIITNNPNFTIE